MDSYQITKVRLDQIDELVVSQQDGFELSKFI